MTRHLLVATALVAALPFMSTPSRAYYDGPWCAVHSMGRGGAIENCDYQSFEACRMEVISGNRGFCRQNPAWPGYYASPVQKHVRKRARR